ncbi:terminase small subunit [Methylobacterium sp. J-030]|uniref:terminase small subunit n=1 Tax=Methylobacterium sp. J-030 TaxID=2836627 RepID=UPI001FB93DB4|nr:terminase small subunit [Methylobacterium sp. J-030]MCJ2069394.1 terminase small subunit [Methylobacterium sp. J-030]
MNPLNPRQHAFVRAFLVGETAGIASASAVAAGYSADSAPDLMKNPSVVKAIADAQAEAAAATGITMARVAAELARIGFSDLREVLQWRTLIIETGDENDDGEPITKVSTELVLKDWAELSPSAAACISEIKRSRDGSITVKLHPKVAALVELGRHLGLPTKVALSGSSGEGPVELITREMTAEEAADLYRRTLDEGTTPQ